MATELAVIELWLRATLAGDATLTTLLDGGGVYRGLIPTTQAKPSIVFHYEGALDEQNVSGDSILTDAVYVVKGVAAGASPAPLVALYSRVHAILQKAEGSATGGRVISCTRLEDGFVNYTDDVNFTHLGGRYRILAQLD